MSFESLSRFVSFIASSTREHVPHTTDAVIAFIVENHLETLKWPPQSPDLSPFENIWNAMKMKMKAMEPRPRSHAQMRAWLLLLSSQPCFSKYAQDRGMSGGTR